MFVSGSIQANQWVTDVDFGRFSHFMPSYEGVLMKSLNRWFTDLS